MWLSQKCYYAVLAIYELARRELEAPLKTGDVAASADVPARFLEVILHQLKQAGFVQSRRGAEGGYALAKPARLISVGDVVRFVGGPLAPVSVDKKHLRPGSPAAALAPVWQRAEQALSDVFDATSFAELVEQERARRLPIDFSI